eukprot:CAMPEP_0118635658 /NCGR_PEP_ID=MMETSP0785-20121206/2193_1 /TAXON_ID=91992 /ORGANISM="Bolidomonas pacifica, Strain CCMP 1866" /LENGTH=445 /DNA_ID=CAMNT_0006526705 /DNA_START=98 /DNA_END=1432 /DNA_ORIENTATION=+
MVLGACTPPLCLRALSPSLSVVCLALLLLAIVAVAHGQISPETILPMHERNKRAEVQTANITDPSLDIVVQANPSLTIGNNNMIIQPYWHKVLDGSDGEVKFPMGYQLKSEMLKLPRSTIAAPKGSVLVQVDGVPVADFDFFEDILADPKGAIGTSSAKMVPVVEKKDKNSDSFNTIGFLKVEYIEQPETLTFRPIGERRFDMSMQAMAAYAEDQVRQLEQLKKEMERKEKEEAELREKLLKEREAEIERKVREQMLKEEKDREAALAAKSRMEEEKKRKEEEAKRATEAAAEAARRAKETAAEAAERKRKEEIEEAQRAKEEAKREREEKARQLKEMKEKQERLLNHEYPISQTGEEKTNLMNGRNNIPSFEFTIVFDNEDISMGMSFDLDSKEGTIVSEVAPGSPAMIAGIAPGDKLVTVGGESIVGLDVKKGIKKVMKLKWP